MQSWSGLLALTVAVSLDGLAAGFSYGLKGTKLSRFALLIVAASSLILLAAALLAGHQIGVWLAPMVGRLLGGLLLVVLGLVQIAETVSRRLPKTMWQLRLKRLGLIIQIFRDPEQADLDGSGTICPYEALVLGIALGLDGAGVGLGLGISGREVWWFPALVAGVNLLFIKLGTWLGSSWQGAVYPRCLAYLPGMLLVLLGLLMIV